MGVYNVYVERQITYNSSFYPKDRIVDFETNGQYAEWRLEQSVFGNLNFMHGSGAKLYDTHFMRNPSGKRSAAAPQTWYPGDEDWDGSRGLDFYHSLGVVGQYLIQDADSNVVSPWTSFNGAQQVPPTYLLQGQIIYGNGPVGNPEVRHNKVTNPNGNKVDGCFGAGYPYRLSYIRVSDPVYKWKDLSILWYLNLRSVFNSGNWDLGNTGFQSFKVFQQAIAITKNGASIVPNNTSGKTTLATPLILNKTLNRGTKNGSTWTIQKKNGLGTYVTATPGLEYVLNTGTLLSDIMEIQFMVPGDFKVINTATGGSSVATGPNIGTSTLLIRADLDNVLITVDDKITFPNLIANVVPTSTFTNIVTDGAPAPLGGIESFSVDVTPSLNMDLAEWIQTTITDTNGTVTQTTVDKTNDLSESQWLQLILDKANVQCVVVDTTINQIVQSRNCQDLGYNQTFILTRGNYTCGYIVQPI